jgi:7-dehydrocholesterol reductase
MYAAGSLDTLDGAKHFRGTLAPLLLLIACPPLTLVLWTIVVVLDGSLQILRSRDGLALLRHNLPSPSWTAASMVLLFAAVEVALLGLRGRTAPALHRLSGLRALFATHALFWLGVWADAYRGGVLYDHLGAILATVCVIAFGVTGTSIFSVNLHLSASGVDLKQLCNGWLGMLGWSVLVVSFAAKQHELYGEVSSGMCVAVALQLAYILKFFATDVADDRFGRSLCWDVLCWLPGVHALSTLYLVRHPARLTTAAALALLTLGLVALWIRYAADLQRQLVRRCGGRLQVWGRAPRVILARYRTVDGEEHTNLLLASGYWGLARHFHYLPELALTLAWTIPVGTARVVPYLYFACLCILLVDRARRDEHRCAN